MTCSLIDFTSSVGGSKLLYRNLKLNKLQINTLKSAASALKSVFSIKSSGLHRDSGSDSQNFDPDRITARVSVETRTQSESQNQLKNERSLVQRAFFSIFSRM